MVSSGGGDPPCVSSCVVSCCATGVRAAPRFRGGLRLAALLRVAVGRRFAAGRRLALVRRFVAVRRFAVVRRFEVVRRFTASAFSEPSARSPHVSYASPYVASWSPASLYHFLAKGNTEAVHSRDIKPVSLARFSLSQWTKSQHHLELKRLLVRISRLRMCAVPPHRPNGITSVVYPDDPTAQVRNTLTAMHVL